MRICIDARAAISITDGIGRYARELIRAIARMNDDNQYIILKHPTLDFSFAFDERFSERVIHAKRFSPVEQLQLVPILNAMDLDVLHSLHFTIPFFYGGPKVVTVHDIMPAVLPWFFGSSGVKARLASAYINFMVKRSLSRASAIIVDSDHTARDIEKFFGSYADRISRIYLGIDHTDSIVRDDKTEMKWNKEIDKAYFFVVTNFRPYKNIPRLLEAFQIARKRIGNVELLIAGSNKKYKSQELDEIPTEWLDAVRFLGFVPDEDMPQLFAHSLAFVFPSLYEGFGFPILEAMSAGAPVITSAAASLPELGGDAVCYVDPENTLMIADTLVQLASDEKLRTILREKGKKQSEKFLWANTARQTLDVYKRVLL